MMNFSILTKPIERFKEISGMGEKFILFFCILIIVISAGFILYNHQTKHIIAVAGPMTGLDKKNGKAMIKGINLFLMQESNSQVLDELNLEIQIFDDQNDPKRAIQIAKEIVSNKNVVMVLGHYNSSTSCSASEIYKKEGIPSITSSATADDLINSNQWYFRVIPGNNMQGRFIANYIYSSLKKKKVAILYEKNVYGQSLQKSFEKEALKLKMHIKSWGIEPKEMESNIADIISELREIENYDIVFIAAHNALGAKLIASLKYPGASFSIIGSDTFSNELFYQYLKEESFQEKACPGYHSENIYALSPFIIEAGEEKAQQFKKDYITLYKDIPSWVPAAYYDAIHLAVHAIRYAKIKENTDIAQIRQNTKNCLQGISSVEKSIKGVTGKIYFDKNGSVQRPFHIGVYKNQQYIPALSQYQPFKDAKNVKNIIRKILKGEVIKIDKTYTQKVRVVFTGIDINTISELNLANQTYAVDFYLWFRYELCETNLVNIEFENTVEPLYLDDRDALLLPGVTKVLDKLNNGIITKAYRIKQLFKNDFDFHPFPFDHHKLNIKFRHRNLTNNKLTFISDAIGMSHKKSKQLSISGWDITNKICFKDMITNQSSFGDSDLFNKENTIKFSRYNAEIHIKRKIWSYLVKNLFVMFMLLCVTYLTFFIPPDQFSIRISICMSAFITTAFSHIKTGSSLPCDYILAIEFAFFGVYLITAISILISIICYKLYQVENNTTFSDSTKTQAFDRRKMTTLFGLIAHPVTILVICYFLYLHTG
jgi:branched-chain amino acid transport system substrate-binding protein